jgi:hypothetical protein
MMCCDESIPRQRSPTRCVKGFCLFASLYVSQIRPSGLFTVSELTSETVNPFRHFGRTTWTGDRPIASTYIGHHNTEKRGYTTMPPAAFEPMIRAFERFQTILVPDRAATETGGFIGS